jgi:FAD-dependent urate hydroxylase
MPIAGDRFYFFFDVPLSKEEAQNAGEIRAELEHFFADWAAPIQALIQRLEPDKTNRVLIHDIEPLATLVRGRVALLGDSAHGTAPDLGQGGSQAIEDAFVLTNYLKTTTLSVADALKRYEAERKDRVADIITRAHKRADMIHGKDPDKTQQWYAELKGDDGAETINGIAKTILGGPLR